jgi:hypothetical protein
MLFDLRGRGRRRTIQAIYLFLALLLGGGLIFFGIGGGGGGGGGGLLNAVGNNGGNNNSSDVFQSNAKAAEKKVVATPNDPAAWAALVHARFQVAGTGKNFDQAAGKFTASGQAELARVKQAWDHYLALKPKTPSADTAKEMVQVLGPAGLNQLPAAVAAEEVVVGQNATNPAEYVRLGVLAYLARQTRKGDLAFAQAISLEPKDQQATFRQQLATAKTQALAETTQPQQTTPSLPGG